MANVTITSSTNYLEIHFNDYSAMVGFYRASISKTSLYQVMETTDETKVQLITRDNGMFLFFSFSEQSGAMIVDSIDGVAITSLDDLYEKLRAFLA